MGRKEITLTLEGDRVDELRSMTGVRDEEWLKMAVAVYYQLMVMNADSVVRFQTDDGRITSMGLTPEADRNLRTKDNE